MLGALIAAEDWEGLAAYAAARFDVTVSAESLEEECRCRLGVMRRYVHDLLDYEHGLTAWLKQRLAGLGAFEAGGAGQPEVRVFAVLHVGFARLAETEEQLARLRGEPEPIAPVPPPPPRRGRYGPRGAYRAKGRRPASLDDGRPVFAEDAFVGKVARSKIFAGGPRPRPIDAVAHRVAPPE